MTSSLTNSTGVIESPKLEHAMPSSHSTPSHHDAPGGRATPLDSPWRTMFGLIILWGSLSLIFWAHRLDPASRIEAPTAGGPAAHAVAALTASTDLMLLPYEIHMPSTAPRDAVTQIAANLGLQCSPEELGKMLSAEPRNFLITGLPLFKAMHRLIANPEVGYAVDGKRIRLFYQKLHSPDVAKKQLAWEAETELSERPIAFFPSGESNRWFTVQMIRDVNQADDPWRLAQVELWNGAEKEATARIPLGADGMGLFSAMSSRQNVSLQIKRVAPAPEARTPGRRHLIFNFQAFD